MAQRTILVDDVNGSEGDVRTVQFHMNGINYAVDLDEGNRQILTDAVSALEKFRNSARPVETTQTEDRSGKKQQWEYEMDFYNEDQSQIIERNARRWRGQNTLRGKECYGSDFDQYFADIMTDLA